MVTTYPLVQLVDAPDPSARVRFDFNVGLKWAEHDGFSVGTPQLLGTPGGVGAEYGYRQPRFRLVIEGGRGQALAAQSRLARELMRDENWLHFRLAPDAPPMWLRLLRPSPGEMSLANVSLERAVNQWLIDVNLVADPFAVGEEIAFALTFGNDPATGGLVATLPPIAGDAPTPLTVELSSGGTTYIQPLVSVFPALDRPAEGPEVWQAESMSRGTAGVSVADADASAGFRAVFPMRPAGGGMARRLTRQIAPRYAGRYRLFARVAHMYDQRVDLAALIQVRGGGAALVEPVTTSIPVGGWRVVDLGIYAFPKGNMPTQRGYTLAATNEIGLDAGITNADGAPWTGDGNELWVDYIVAVPVDAPLDQAGPPTLLAFQSSAQTSGNRILRIDGERGRVEELTGQRWHPPATPETPVGGFPVAVPGAFNIMHLLTRRRASVTNFSDQVGNGQQVAVSYRPRWLWLASYGGG